MFVGRWRFYRAWPLCNDPGGHYRWHVVLGQGSSLSTHQPPCPRLPRPPQASSKCPQEEQLCPQGPGLQDTGVNLCDTTWPRWPWPLPGRHPLLAAVEPGLGHRKGLYPPWSRLAVASETQQSRRLTRRPRAAVSGLLCVCAHTCARACVHMFSHV